MVDLPYENSFDERQISTKARPIQMNMDLEKHCQQEIKDLESKGLIVKSRSPWSCATFYVNKNSEIERGTPRLVINLLPFGLKNAHSEFQRIMNDIYNSFSDFCIVYIDDVLIFSQSIEQHFKHLKTFYLATRKAGLAISSSKVSLFQTKVRFLGHYISKGTITSIERSLAFTDKFPDKILDKTQLQRFLGSLNYVLDFCPNINRIAKPLHDRLKKTPVAWSEEHTKIVKHIKTIVKKHSMFISCKSCIA